MLRSYAKLCAALLISVLMLVMVLSIAPAQVHAGGVLPAQEPTYSIKFYQNDTQKTNVQGIPNGFTWGVCIGSTTYSSCLSNGGAISTGTGPSITVSGLEGTVSFSYATPVNGAVGVQYQVSGGAYYGSATGASTETAYYTTYYQVSFAVSPTGSGTISPTTTSFYANQSGVWVYGTPNAGYLFSSFSSSTAAITLGSPTPSGTYTYALADVYGPGTITANFVAGTYSITFNQADQQNYALPGFPSALTWSVCTDSTGINNYASCASGGGTVTTGTGPSITVSGLSGVTTWAYVPEVNGLTSNVEYQISGGAYYGSLSYGGTVTTYYTTYYQVSFAVSPTGSGTISPTTTSFYANQSGVWVYGTPNAGYLFSSFSSSTAAITLGSPTPSGTYTYALADVYGPGTITANFVAGTYSYSITFNQADQQNYALPGFPSALTWSVCTDSTGINNYASCASGGGTVTTGTGPSITVSGLSGVTTWAYVPEVNGLTSNVEYQISGGAYYGSLSYGGTVTTYYTTYYQVSFAVSPTGSGTISPTTTSFYANQSGVWVYGTPNAGYLFSSFSSSTAAITLGSPTPSGTYTYALADVYGPGTITANFVAGTYSITFNQADQQNYALPGFPSALTWSVCTDSTGINNYASCASGGGTVTTGTGPSITVSGLSGVTTWAYVPEVNGLTSNVEYQISGGAYYGSLSYGGTVTTYYTTYYQVSFAVSPTGSGTISPTTTSFYANQSGVWVYGTPNAGYTFSSFSNGGADITFGATSISGSSTYALADVYGPGTITANFVSIPYSVTFDQTGIPGTVTWGVTVGGIGDTTGTGSSITVTGITGVQTYSYDSPVAGASGVQYASSCSGSVTGAGSELCAYTTQYQVSFVVSPPGSGTTIPSTSTYYDAGSSSGISATPNTGFEFIDWSNGGASINFVTSTSSSTAAQINGPGTITANFASTSYSVTFDQSGIPGSVTWGVTVNGVDHTGTGASITVTGLGGTLAYTYDTPVSGYTCSTGCSGSVSEATTEGATYTYSVTFDQTGIPGSVTWGVTVGGLDNSGTGGSITVNGLTGTLSYSYDSPVAGASGVQYVSSCSGTVAGAGTQSCTYTTQYQVSFAVIPSGTGATSPSTTAYYNSGYGLSIMASPNGGYTFSSWSNGGASIAFTSSTSSSTTATINGPGTITANFSPVSAPYTVTFDQTGIPGSVTWGVTVGGADHTGTGSSITVTSITGTQAYSYDSPIAGATDVQYASSCSGLVTGAGSQSCTYTTQYQVSFAVSPLGSGTTTPSTTAYYNAAAGVPISGSANSGYQFSSWSNGGASITFASSTSSPTTATINGPGTITANFVVGTYSVTFQQTGIPGTVTWGVTVGAVDNTGTGSSITVIGLTGTVAYSYDSPVAGASGTQYVSACTGSVTGAGSQSCTYTTQYQVSFAVSPTGSGTTTPTTTAYYHAGTGLPISATPNGGYTFSSWSNGGASIAFTSSTSSSTTATINGPGTITANFSPVSAPYTVTFDQTGIPGTVTWGVTVGTNHYTGTGGSITVSGLTGTLATPTTHPFRGAALPSTPLAAPEP